MTDPQGKLRIFISWSGKRSKAIADVLNNWLEEVVQNFKPWVSFNDIEMGAKWLHELHDKLAVHDVGILCVTRDNQANPWLLYEAGALSKVANAVVCPLVDRGMKLGEVNLPLGALQAGSLDSQEDMLKLIRNFNALLGEHKVADRVLEKSFLRTWPDLEKVLDAIPPHEGATPKPKDKDERLEERLDEIVGFVRSAGQRDRSDEILGLLQEMARPRMFNPSNSFGIPIVSGSSFSAGRFGGRLVSVDADDAQDPSVSVVREKAGFVVSQQAGTKTLISETLATPEEAMACVNNLRLRGVARGPGFALAYTDVTGEETAESTWVARTAMDVYEWFGAKLGVKL